MSIRGLSCIFPVPDIKKTEEYYVNCLGFKAVEYLNCTEAHVCLYLDDIEIILLKTNNNVQPNRALYGYGYDAYLYTDDQEVLDSLKAGANAYCSKEINPKRLTQVVQSVLDGAAWFDPSISHIVLEAATKSQNISTSKPERDYGLTSRETQILKLITEGYSNIEIAKELFVSINTTKAHVASILQKLEVDDRLQAALKALKERLV